MLNNNLYPFSCYRINQKLLDVTEKAEQSNEDNVDLFKIFSNKDDILQELKFTTIENIHSLNFLLNDQIKTNSENLINSNTKTNLNKQL